MADPERFDADPELGKVVAGSGISHSGFTTLQKTNWNDLQ